MGGIKDRVEAPFTPHALARALRWAKEWYVHEKRPDSITTAVAIALFDVAAEDFDRAAVGRSVERTVLSLRDVQSTVDALRLEEPPDPDTVKALPAAVERNLRDFRHYARLGRHWYRFGFTGPRQRRAPTERRAASYYLAVEYELVPRGVVPRDRLAHRPFNRDRRHIVATAPTPARDAIPQRAALYTAVKTLLSTDQPVLSIQGVAGVGKTEFVAALLQLTPTYFPDGHVYLHTSIAGQRRAIDEVLREAILRLDPSATVVAGTETLIAQYRALVVRHACVVVCEDVLVADDALPFLPPSGCALVVTSRNRIVLPGVTAPRVLTTPSPVEAERFLRALAPRMDVAADAELIAATEAAVPDLQLARRLLTMGDVVAQLVGDLPLALRVCGRYLAQHPDVPTGAFARRLFDARYRVALTGARGEKLSVEASVSISYEALAEDEQRAFRRLGICPSSFDRISAILITDDPTRLGDGDAPRLVSELVQQGLVTFDPAQQRYRMHELLRAYGRSRMNDDEQIEARAKLAHACRYFGQKLLLDVQRGDSQQLAATERTFAEEFPNTALVVGELFADLNTIDVLFEASNVVLGIAPFLLRTAPDRLFAWSDHLWRAFAPLAEADVLHPQRFPTERAHVHAGPDWGRAALRRVHHAYHSGLAAESVSPQQALRYYAAVGEDVRQKLPRHVPAASIERWTRGRAARQYRRSEVRPEENVVAFVSRAIEDTEAGLCGMLLHELVVAQLHGEYGHKDAVAFCATQLRRWQQSTSRQLPYEAAFLLDAVGEHAPVWFWALHTHVVHVEEGLNALTLHEAVESAAAGDPPDGVLVDEVARWFRQQPPDRVRTPAPLAAGYALIAMGHPEDALRLFDAAARVCEATADLQGLIAGRAGRAKAYEAVAEDDRALADWEWLLRVSPAPEWQEACDRARQRVAAQYR